MTMVTFVPLPMKSMLNCLVSGSYVIASGRTMSMISNSSGISSLKTIPVAFVPLGAFETVIVQTAVSSTKYSSLSVVILTDKSTIGIGLIVQLTISLAPLGPTTVKLLVNSTMSLTLTLMTIVAVVLPGMFVKIQVMT